MISTTWPLARCPPWEYSRDPPNARVSVEFLLDVIIENALVLRRPIPIRVFDNGVLGRDPRHHGGRIRHHVDLVLVILYQRSRRTARPR